MSNLYDTPPTGWVPAKDETGHIHHWDGPAVVGPAVFLVSTFRLNDGITIENAEGTMIDPRELLHLAGLLLGMHKAVERAEKEING